MYRKPIRHKPDILMVLVMLVGLGVAVSIGYQLHSTFQVSDMAAVKTSPAPLRISDG